MHTININVDNNNNPTPNHIKAKQSQAKPSKANNNKIDDILNHHLYLIIKELT